MCWMRGSIGQAYGTLSDHDPGNFLQCVVVCLLGQTLQHDYYFLFFLFFKEPIIERVDTYE